MTKDEQKIELEQLAQSLRAGVISNDEYLSGVDYIISNPDTEFCADVNFGLQDEPALGRVVITQKKKVIHTIPYDNSSKQRALRVATYLRTNPEELKVQQELTERIRKI